MGITNLLLLALGMNLLRKSIGSMGEKKKIRRKFFLIFHYTRQEKSKCQE